MQVQIYIKKDREAQWESFKQTCKREGDSVSKKILKWVEEYMQAHGDGNPQTLLKYAGKPKTLPLYKTCRYSKKKNVKGEFLCLRDSYWKLVKACNRCENYDYEGE